MSSPFSGENWDLFRAHVVGSIVGTADMADPKEKADEVSTKSTRGNEVSSRSKGKAPAKRTQPSAQPSDDSHSQEGNKQLNDKLILECLKNIQSSQECLVKRMDAYENTCETQYEEYPYEYEEDECGPSSPKRSCIEPGTSGTRPSAQSNSMFATLSKKFKPAEICSADVDPILADNVNDLFRKGMDSELYEKTVKDENCPRPENCEGLIPAKMNKLVWDVMSQQSRTVD